jgi:hypothetical protein
MSASNLSELIGGLSAGVAGVVLIVIGVPLCVAIFARALIRAYRGHRLERALLGVVVVAGVALLGSSLWGFSTASAPGVYDEPLTMLAYTFLPFTVAFALLSIIVQHYSQRQATNSVPARQAVNLAQTR